jgi:hypothetical protein
VGDGDADVRVNGKKIGRNEPCLCGSGKKFKVCCMEARLAEERQRRDLEQLAARASGILMNTPGAMASGHP